MIQVFGKSRSSSRSVAGRTETFLSEEITLQILHFWCIEGDICFWDQLKVSHKQQKVNLRVTASEWLSLRTFGSLSHFNCAPFATPQQLLSKLLSLCGKKLPWDGESKSLLSVVWKLLRVSQIINHWSLHREVILNFFRTIFVASAKNYFQV